MIYQIPLFITITILVVAAVLGSDELSYIGLSFAAGAATAFFISAEAARGPRR